MAWTVDTKALTDVMKQKRNITVITSNMNCTLSSNLTIHALPINNKIEIGCVVHSFHPILMAVAKEVELTVIGH